MTEVLTVGHSNREFDAFVALLRAHEVGRIVDVRTVPRSRRVPWSSRDALPHALAERDIGYVHVPELGGLRKARADSPNDAWENASFRGYADHMMTEEFERGIQMLVTLAEEARCAIMCAEAVPWRCHRFLVADALVARGATVLHIMTESKAQPHRLRDFARVVDGRVTYPAATRQARLGDGD